MGAGSRQSSRLATGLARVVPIMDKRELKGLFPEFGSRWPAHDPAVGNPVLFVNECLADVQLFTKNPDLGG